MSRRSVACMLAALNILTATLLELCGINPRDQVILVIIFGFYAVHCEG